MTYMSHLALGNCITGSVYTLPVIQFLDYWYRAKIGAISGSGFSNKGLKKQLSHKY